MFIQNLRAKVGARLNGDKEAGFTLIELLVVMLILGILAAIALPAFFNQKSKASDAKAKETAHTVQVAMETCSTEHGGKYSSVCEETTLGEIEPTLSGQTFTAEPDAAEEGYTIEVEGSSGHEFEIVRTDTGSLEYPCTPAGEGGCPKDSEGNGDWGEG